MRNESWPSRIEMALVIMYGNETDQRVPEVEVVMSALLAVIDRYAIS